MDWVVLFHFFFRGKEIDDDVVMMKWEHDGVFYFGGYKLLEYIMKYYKIICDKGYVSCTRLNICFRYTKSLNNAR